MNKNTFLSYLGTILIGLSLLGLGVTFYPVVAMYLYPSALTPVVKKGTFITIPKIHAQAPVILNVDPWNEAAYKEALHHGVAHAKGTQLPGQKGTTYLFAHSSGMPWEITGYNTVFLRLPELDKDDQIILTVDGKQHKYAVAEKKEIQPTDVSYLVNSTRNMLILQTCTPIGTSLRRLLIFASPV
jgi:LPXTG-site transpeptidase (sortase) family protein